MMVEKGFFEEKNTEKPQRKEKGKQNHQEGTISDSEMSVVTIYKNAVPGVNEVLVTRGPSNDPEIEFNFDKGQDSSSSADKIDMSDELMEVDPNISEQFIADCVRETERRNSKGAE